jgi:uncharacterized protein YjiS (DUF1127 family)
MSYRHAAIWDGARLPASRGQHQSLLFRILGSLKLARTRQPRRDTLDLLLGADDRILDDLGVTRADVHALRRKRR